MSGPRPGRPIARLALASFATILFVLSGVVPAAPTASALSRWTGGVDLYRSGVFTTQKTWLWCTAADVQIIRNIVDRQTDHSRTHQQTYFDYMRAHDRYRIPVADGVDPAGWAAGLRHYVDARYHLVASTSFGAALRSAVTNLRKTNLPVGLTVGHGTHAWVLTGFTATADPAKTSSFTVTSVRVTGPLWGLQSRTYGYDMRPDTRLTPRQLRGFFTPWHYAGIRMAWEGRWVSIQPIPKAAAVAAPSASAGSASTPSARATAPPPSTPPSPSASAGAAAALPPAFWASASPDQESAASAPRGVDVPATQTGPAAPVSSGEPGPLIAALVAFAIGGGVLLAVKALGRRRVAA